MAETVRGSCVCGTVAFEAEGPFFAFQYCHCSRCRKASGSAFATNLFASAPQFRWTGGETKVRRFDLPDAKYWSHTFCDTCGSSLPWKTRTGKAYVIPAGTLDVAPSEVQPQRNIFFGSKGDWYVEPHTLETFETFPAKGEG